MQPPFPFDNDTVLVAYYASAELSCDSTAAASRSGERQRPVCMVAKELRTGQTWRLWRGQVNSVGMFQLWGV